MEYKDDDDEQNERIKISKIFEAGTYSNDEDISVEDIQSCQRLVEETSQDIFNSEESSEESSDLTDTDNEESFNEDIRLKRNISPVFSWYDYFKNSMTDMFTTEEDYDDEVSCYFLYKRLRIQK